MGLICFGCATADESPSILGSPITPVSPPEEPRPVPDDDGPPAVAPRPAAPSADAPVVTPGAALRDAASPPPSAPTATQGSAPQPVPSQALVDAMTVPLDSDAQVAARSSVPLPTHAGADASTDAGADASTDAGADASTDADVDASTDVGADASSSERDAAPPSTDAALVGESPYPEDLVVHWPFEEGGATKITNAGALGARNDCSFAAADSGEPVSLPTSDGLVGVAALFDGSAYASCGDAPWGGAAPRTVSLWVKNPPEANSVAVFGWGSGARRWDLASNTNRNSVDLLTGSGQVAHDLPGVGWADGGWHHLVTVLASGQTLGDVVLYADATRFSEALDTRVDTDPNGTLTIGIRSNRLRDVYSGSVDDIAIWNRGLAQAEVLAVSNLGRVGFDAGVAARLFAGFSRQDDVVAGGRTWQYMPNGAPGFAGFLRDLDGTYLLNLGNGAGFISEAPAP